MAFYLGVPGIYRQMLVSLLISKTSIVTDLAKSGGFSSQSQVGKLHYQHPMECTWNKLPFHNFFQIFMLLEMHKLGIWSIAIYKNRHGVNYHQAVHALHLILPCHASVSHPFSEASFYGDHSLRCLFDFLLVYHIKRNHLCKWSHGHRQKNHLSTTGANPVVLGYTHPFPIWGNEDGKSPPGGQCVRLSDWHNYCFTWLGQLAFAIAK